MTETEVRPEAEVPPAQVSWSGRLSEPFDEWLVMARPQVWCPNCRNATGRVCNDHHKGKCMVCKQSITDAHLHLDYVGHADVTERLNQVDPKWWWEPVARDADPEMLKLALASGNPEIVKLVLDNALPKQDQFGGVWIRLFVHDDDGNVQHKLGYGDAQGKTGNNAVKEIIGDAIRNAAMRFGVALQLWSKADRAEQDQDGELQTRQQGTTQRKRRRRNQGGEDEMLPPPDGLAKEAPNPVDAQIQALADLAWVLKAQEGATPEKVKTDVYEVAKSNRWLNKPVRHPDTHRLVPLSTVIQEAKDALEAKGA